MFVNYWLLLSCLAVVVRHFIPEVALLYTGEVAKWKCTSYTEPVFTKYGEEIKRSARIEIQNIGFNFYLSIKSTKKSDSGRYGCSGISKKQTRFEEYSVLFVNGMLWIF